MLNEALKRSAELMKQNPTPCITNLFMLTIAGIVNAFGITLFMTPVKLYDSGISGTSTLFEHITPSYLSLSLFLLILNIPLFLIGLKKQGKKFTFYAIYTVFIYSLFA
ncbi:YitT family protein [Holdemanella biformis]